jgi:large subunit ribosomal protein L10
MAIRRELTEAMRKVDEAESTPYADYIKLHIVKTGIFDHSLRVVEFFKPEQQQADAGALAGTAGTLQPKHFLSAAAHEAAADKKLKHGLEQLFSGPLAILTIPAISPAHLKAAFSILAPSPKFPAPKRKSNPSYYEAPIQNGLPKLMLLGARIEGKVFDTDGARWIGGIPGGIHGLRAQLVGMLQGFGAGITNTLETAGRSVYFTMESRKSMLEEDGSPKESS